VRVISCSGAEQASSALEKILLDAVFRTQLIVIEDITK